MAKTPNPQWPPDTTGVFTASERRLFAPVGKAVSAGQFTWTAAERRLFARRSGKARTKGR